MKELNDATRAMLLSWASGAPNRNFHFRPYDGEDWTGGVALYLSISARMTFARNFHEPNRLVRHVLIAWIAHSMPTVSANDAHDVLDQLWGDTDGNS